MGASTNIQYYVVRGIALIISGHHQTVWQGFSDILSIHHDVFLKKYSCNIIIKKSNLPTILNYLNTVILVLRRHNENMGPSNHHSPFIDN